MKCIHCRNKTEPATTMNNTEYDIKHKELLNEEIN